MEWTLPRLIKSSVDSFLIKDHTHLYNVLSTWLNLNTTSCEYMSLFLNDILKFFVACYKVINAISCLGWTLLRLIIIVNMYLFRSHFFVYNALKMTLSLLNTFFEFIALVLICMFEFCVTYNENLIAAILLRCICIPQCLILNENMFLFRGHMFFSPVKPSILLSLFVTFNKNQISIIHLCVKKEETTDKGLVPLVPCTSCKKAITMIFPLPSPQLFITIKHFLLSYLTLRCRPYHITDDIPYYPLYTYSVCVSLSMPQ